MTRTSSHISDCRFSSSRGLALHDIGRALRPRASAAAFALTLVGTIYVGGLFGIWTSFYDGLARVDARYMEGASATFAALTAPRGAFLLTTTLAKLAFVGLALRGLVLWGSTSNSRVAALSIAIGCGIFLAFWDLDNWMLLGSVLLLAGLAAGLQTTPRNPAI